VNHKGQIFIYTPSSCFHVRNILPSLPQRRRRQEVQFANLLSKVHMCTSKRVYKNKVILYFVVFSPVSIMHLSKCAHLFESIICLSASFIFVCLWITFERRLTIMRQHS